MSSSNSNERLSPHVAVCVATFRRPEGLRRLLASLDALTFETHMARVVIVVVDNDADESARPVIDAFEEAGSRWSIRYAVEPRRGISFARNMAIATVPPDSDFVAFVDDDETVAPDWLDRLLLAMKTHNADIVTGPVMPIFSDSVPEWIRTGGFFNAPNRQTGRELDRAYTGNVLFRREVLGRVQPPFDERLALSGGEDTMLTRQLSQTGARIVWDANAIAYEWIGSNRLTAMWLIRRAYRTGSVQPIIERMLAGWMLGTLRTALSGVIHIAVGAMLLVPRLITGRIGIVRSARGIAYGVGQCVGIFGRRYREYAQSE